MPKAVFFEQTGEPDVLQMKDVAVSTPKDGEVLIQHKAIGVNFIDIQMRKGVYKPPSLPCIPGFEACGVVIKVGAHVQGLKVGDRVAYATAPEPGAYQEMRCIDQKHVVKVPDSINDKDMASILLKGLTAQYLLRRVFVVRSGRAVLIHAAAGGVGRVMSRWANIEGALVIGTVGSDDKKKIAEDAGCHFVVNHTDPDWNKQVREITKGIGVNAVYDSIGRDTFHKSLDCLMIAGIMISFGQSSGPVEQVNLAALRAKSLFLTSPTLFDYSSNNMALLLAFDEVFDAIAKKIIVPSIYKTYNLADAAAAHKTLESRKATGSIVLNVE